MRILIADDEKELNAVVAKRLVMKGFTVDCCYNGEEAMDYLRFADYDAIILDIMMPKMTRPNVLSRLRERQFTNDASHELRTPVSIIMAQSELALDDKARSGDRTEALESINRQSHRINKLLSELLSLARSDNGKTVLEKESFDLSELAEMVVEEEKALAEAKGITLSLTAKEPAFVFADQTLIMRALINLITNSVKYGKDGGSTEISVERRGEHGAVCRVKDNGIGITKDDLSKVWNRFFRVDTARTADGSESFGLGLAVVKSIIEAHGGTVSAESVLGEGSVFEFTI